MPAQHRIVFWNIENLFDIEGSPRRNEKLARALGDSIVDWTQALLEELRRLVTQLRAQTKDG